MRKLLIVFFLQVGCNSQSTATAVDGMPPDPNANVNVDSAQAKYPDLRTFWSRSVARTCGPNNGVCHDNRQFPDMQRASGLLDAVNQRCNQIRTDPATIDNLCEPSGDLLQIGSFRSRIGHVSASPASAPTTVTITLHDPAPKNAAGALAVVRDETGLSPLSFPIPSTALKSVNGSTVTLDYAVLSNASQAPGPGSTTMAPFSMAGFLLPPVLTPGSSTEVVMGDPNGDGVFGADLGGALVKPGDPLKSYLFLRVLSPLAVGNNMMTSMSGAPTNEAQMPIANFQYWDIDNDLTALWCWISTMKPDGSNADGPIDYASCDTSNMPKPMHQGGEATTFSSVYADVFVPYCKSCHFTGTTQPTTLVMDDLQSTYDRLLGIAGSGPSESSLGLPYVTRSDPSKSYLMLKLNGDPSITGAKMPLGADLPPDLLSDVATWITQGANDD